MTNKITLLFLFLGSGAFAQNSINVNSSIKESISSSTKSAKPTYVIKHPHDAYFDQKVEEYKKRMEANVKEHKKMARKMEKPQYSDPSYFGHKRKPKKRGPGKRKFCKECEIVH